MRLLYRFVRRWHFTMMLSCFFVVSVHSQAQIALRPLPKSGFEQRIEKFVRELEIVDTHEHLMDEAGLTNRKSIDFSLLLLHYADDDIKSAGMSKQQFEEILGDKLSVMQKWTLVKPYWEASKNTAYNRAVLLAIDKLFGIPDLNEHTVELISQKLRASYNGSWYQHVLKEKARFKYVIQDVGASRSADTAFYRYVEKFDQFIRIHSGKEIAALAATRQMSVTTLDAYVDMLHAAFQEGVKRGMVGVKSALAYHRPLKYEKVSKGDAERIFRRLMDGEGAILDFATVKPFQDYIMHQLIQLAGRHELPMQFHAGLQSGDGNIIDNANPSHLANLFLEYRDVKFVLFHGGFPYGGILSTQAKSFRNVYIDMCWSAVISPSYTERYLHEWLETVPANKLMAFGGDYHNVESTYAHSLMARAIVAKVLIEKVKTGYLTELEALDAARRMLRDNAIDLFKLHG